MEVPILQRKDGTVPVEDDVRRLLRKSMKAAGKPREEVARKMSEAIRRTVTPSKLADFSRNGTKKRQARFPAAWVSAFCEATGCDELARSVIGQRLRELVELGERVSSLGGLAQEVQERIAKLIGPVQQSKRKRKRTRKA